MAEGVGGGDGGTEDGGFGEFGAGDRDAEEVGLELHEEGVGGHASVDVEGGGGGAGVVVHGV